MSAADRSAGRDVHIYDAIDRTIVLGGLILTNGVINANFYSMVEFFVIFNSDCVLQHEDGTNIERDEQANTISQLQTGGFLAYMVKQLTFKQVPLWSTMKSLCFVRSH